MSAKRTLQKDIVLNVVEQIIGSDGKTQRFQCRASSDEEQPCSYAQVTFVPGNFKRHLISSHPDIARELGFSLDEPPAKKPRSSKLSVDTSRNEVLLGTLQLATGHNMPLRFPEWEGVKTLILPLWKAAGFNFTRDKLAKLITTAAQIMRSIIQKELKQRIICLKIDSASRKGRSVFGINLQYIDENGNVCIRHLAVREMIERQTKENLRKVLEEELQLIAVSLEQLLTVTHDNGANMLAAVRCLRALLKFCEESEDVPLSTVFRKDDSLQHYIDDGSASEAEDSDKEELVEDSGEADEPISDDFSNGQGDAEFDLQDEPDDIDVDLLESIRCGAHTAQLAVWDVIKPYKRRLNAINKSCIRMRHKQFQQFFRLHKVPLPPKVNETRWNVWYILLRYLRSLKDGPFLSVLQSQDSSLDLSRHWHFVDKFCVAFEPMFVLTMKLQKDHVPRAGKSLDVPLSQFYVDWLTCMAKLNAAKDNTLALKLFKAMGLRLEKLNTNMAFKACLYLDPRFNYIGSRRLSNDDKASVLKYLIALNKRLDEISGADTQATEGEDQTQIQNDIVEDFLAGLFEEDKDIAAPGREASDSLLGELVKLESRPKVNITTTHPIDSKQNSTTFQAQPVI
ncbi:uncharacterized protein LOC135704027 [Ochlerotatus camptorhynchus]|uniref:uncharacterized protein LOC135704027 n=1 Tax=Ochlerotatus camptorhynchus TaxID=644619 RepID=UPI0031DBD575